MRGGTIGTVGMISASNSRVRASKAAISRARAAGQFQVIDRGHPLAACDARADARVVALAASRKQVVMPRVSLGRGEATLGVHRGDFIELREGNVRDPRAGAATVRREHGRMRC